MSCIKFLASGDKWRTAWLLHSPMYNVQCVRVNTCICAQMNLCTMYIVYTAHLRRRWGKGIRVKKENYYDDGETS